MDKALEAVRNGENPQLSTREKHIRECFVVPEDGADLDRIEQEIKHMPNYFADYDTTVHFITQEELHLHINGSVKTFPDPSLRILLQCCRPLSPLYPHFQNALEF